MPLRAQQGAGFPGHPLSRGWAAQFRLFIPAHMCPQNLVLPDTFFSFYDLRREFHVQHPSARLARDLTVATMAQGTCDPEGLEWRGSHRLYVSEYVHAGGLYEHTQLALSAESLSACLSGLGHIWKVDMSAYVWGGGSVRAYMSRAKTNVLAGIPRAYVGDLGLGETSHSAHADCPKPPMLGFPHYNFTAHRVGAGNRCHRG